MNRIALHAAILFVFVSFPAFAGDPPTTDDSVSAQSVPADANIPKEHYVFFENEVRPLLDRHCYECHRGDATKGGLQLDSLAAMLAGGESGPAIEIGDPDHSLLIEAVRYESYEMPPSGKLPDKDIDVFEKWIQIGAPWPGSTATNSIRKVEKEHFSEEDRMWWAFRPVADPPVPHVPGSHWARNEIDRFIEAKLHDEGLVPAPEANRETLIRRLSFDVTGLPPTPEQIDAFLNDTSPDAYERLVDQMLDSHHYGERYARHWLDLVRYADSDGYRIDHYRPHAWRYRDYVIKSLNDDKPYDRFVQEQIAGDQLFPGDPEALTATGYLTHGIYEYNSRDVPGQWDIIINEITDTTGDVFLGMGMQCAKCHDHKFDPILQKDYFKLRAFFEPLTIDNEAIAATPEEIEKHALDSAKWESASASIREQLEVIAEPYRKRKRDYAIGFFPEDIQVLMRKDKSERTPREEQYVQLAWRQVDLEYQGVNGSMSAEDKERVLELNRKLAELDSLKPKSLPMVQAVADVGPVSPETVIPKKRTVVEPGYMTLLDPEPADVQPIAGLENATGRRAALARWLTRDDNQLATRVIVNRLWQFHFGRGLAENSSDFGKLSEGPTHPELLDWLTARFVEGGWRMKPIHRLILTSATYRQASTHPQFTKVSTIDPTNRLHWRGNTSRLDAEQIRDAILQVTGQLRTEESQVAHGGPGVTSDQPRRSIYTRVMRNSRDPLLDVFDLPLFFASTSSRDTTTTPIQSLLLINSQTMLRFASGLANRAEAGGADREAAVKRVWKLALGREIRRDELASALSFLDEQTGWIAEQNEVQKSVEVPTGKMPYRDGQSVDVRLKDNVATHSLLVPDSDALDLNLFTVEAFFQLRSVAEDGAVRTIVSKWTGTPHQIGWAFGVTGKGSRRKPQTLVFHAFGIDGNAEKPSEFVAFSDQTIELNRPYYAAVTVDRQTNGGKITFRLKDLSDDDSPLTSVPLDVSLPASFANNTPLGIGTTKFNASSRFDGLIDEVRLSSIALEPEALLLAKEAVTDSTVGYWRLDPDPGLYADSSGHELDISRPNQSTAVTRADRVALVDLCHLLLNSNEFLYVD
jgi:hypothetical protein